MTTNNTESSIFEGIAGTPEGESAIAWMRQHRRQYRDALKQLESIRTEKLAIRGLPDEATAISTARVLLSNAKLRDDADRKGTNGNDSQ